MRNIIPLFGLFLIFSCSPIDTSDDKIEQTEQVSTENQETSESSSATTSDLRTKSSILAYFDSLIANQQIIAGQQCGDGPDATGTYYNNFVDVLTDATGREVGVIGADFGFFHGTEYPVQTLIGHWNKGGLVTVSWHADNPFKEGYDVYWNSVENKNNINLKSLLRDSDRTQRAWINYRTELDNVAGALQKLQDAGLTVIWRPFHEMNGDFFWWGIDSYNNQQANEKAFKALWIDLYNTLTYEYGLKNLIWTYSVVPKTNWNAELTAYYPGSDYVDLVGMDYYGKQIGFPDFDTLKSLGKTIVMSESGPADGEYGNWNMMELADALKGKAAYFLQWHSWDGAKVAIKDNRNVIDMMNSYSVITRDEISFDYKYE